jgi:ribosomal protein S18 acetylase RimI-like enzyme
VVTHRPAEKASSTLNPTFLKSKKLSNNDKMSSITRMSPLDLLDLNLTNLDPLTENYDLGFYLNYLTKWPSLFSSVKDRDAGVVGYSMNSNRTL